MKLLLPLFLALAPTAVLADTLALSPSEIEAAKEAGAARNARSATLGQEPVSDRAIHGEVGFSIGTGGYSALYGTAVVPIGDSGFIALSVENERSDFGRYGRNHRSNY